MRTFAQFALTSIATLGLTQLAATPAFAADPNTYRPGQAYLKTSATSFEACEQQCRGDAQCRGWNFVRPNAGARTGVCEFNQRSAMPIGSAISISGEINTSVDPLMSRAVPTGARTIRVGTPERQIQQPVRTQRGATQVNRMPVPGRAPTARPSAHTKPQLPNQDQRQSRTYGGAPQLAPQQSAKTPPQMTPEQQHYRQQFLMEQQRLQQYRAQQQAGMRRQQQMVDPQLMPLPQAAPQQTPAQMMQRPQAQQAAPQMPAQMAPAPGAPLRMSQGPMVQRSLYGSLHDDLTQHTPVQRPQTAPDNLANPDAPVSTSRAAPTKPVQQGPLIGQPLPSLAGG